MLKISVWWYDGLLSPTSRLGGVDMEIVSLIVHVQGA